MDLNRSSHINRADEVVGAEVLPNLTDKQIHQLPENGETWWVMFFFFNGTSVNCAAPENIHTSPATEGFGIS